MAVPWWDCNWSFEKKIIINHSLVESDQTNLPVLLYNSSDTDLRDYAISNNENVTND